MAQKKAESVKGSGLSAAPPQRAAQRSEQRSEDAAAPLVNTTESVHARRVVICPETGVVTSFARFHGRDESGRIRSRTVV